jgi:hypothetical protein
MATDLSEYYEALRRLRRDNPRLDRTMLEDCLRATYRDELENLNLNVSDIYDGCLAEERSAGKRLWRSALRQHSSNVQHGEIRCHGRKQIRRVTAGPWDDTPVCARGGKAFAVRGPRLPLQFFAWM